MFFLLNPFQGQLSRGGWWLSQLVIFVLALAGLFVLAVLFAGEPGGKRAAGEDYALFGLFALVIYTNFCTCINRLRDTGRSGFWYLAFNLPLVGTGLMIYHCGIIGSKNRVASDLYFEPEPDIGRSDLSQQRYDIVEAVARPSPSPAKPAPTVRDRFGRPAPAFGRR